MKFDLITFGACAQDIFLQPHPDSLLVPRGEKSFSHPMLCMGYGEKIIVDDVYYDIGGSACNVAVGASRLGLKTAIISARGDDFAGNLVKERLTKENVGQYYLKKIKNIKTSFSVIINYRGERTIFVYHGLKDYSKLTIPAALPARYLYLGPIGNGYSFAYRQAIALASERNIGIVLNPGAIQIKERPAILFSLLRVTKILILNREEALELSGGSPAAPAKILLSELSKKGPEIVVITDGDNGVYASDGHNFFRLPASRTQLLDATGAGDAFSSGFLACWLKQGSLQGALRWGILNSTLAIERLGAQKGLLTAREINKLLKTTSKLYTL